jgi:hypothetical protein
MMRRLFRRVAAGSAVVAGVTGVAANAFLIAYYVLARPWAAGHSGPYEWLGPANDIVGSISMALLIPVIGYVWGRVRGDRLLDALSGAAMLASAAFAAAGPMLVTGRITLETQFVVAGLGLPVIFGWLWRANRAARRQGLLAPRTARLGRWIGIFALAATALAGIGALLPVGSVAQIVVLGVAAIPGLPAYLTFPVWQILAGWAWLSAEPAAGFADQSRARTPGMSDSTRV